MKRSDIPRVLAQNKRVAIAGGPRTGKSTVAKTCTDRPVMSTDDTMAYPWEDQPEITRRRVEGQESFLIEGIQVGRALRKGMEVDAVIVMEQPVVDRTPAQERMAKGCEKILTEALEMNPNVKVYYVESDE